LYKDETKLPEENEDTIHGQLRTTTETSLGKDSVESHVILILVNVAYILNLVILNLDADVGTATGKVDNSGKNDKKTSNAIAFFLFLMENLNFGNSQCRCGSCKWKRRNCEFGTIVFR
jgi:hypothetical protein